MAGAVLRPIGSQRNLFLADLGKDIADQFLVTSVGHHDEIFVGHQRREAFERMAQE